MNSTAVRENRYPIYPYNEHKRGCFTQPLIMYFIKLDLLGFYFHRRLTDGSRWDVSGTYREYDPAVG